MPHLNLDLDYFEHRKTKRLVGLLSRGAEVLPIKLWRYCGKFHCEDGRLSGYTDQEIESIVEWWGKPGECMRALLTVGFLEKDDVGYFVHDWLKVQGHIKALKERNHNNAVKRWARVRGEYQTGTTGTDGQCSSPSKPSIPTEAGERNDRKPATGPQAEVIAHFKIGWEKRYGTEFVINSGDRGSYGTAFKRLRENCKHDIAVAKRVIDQYLADNDAYLTGRSHPPPLLPGRVNDYNAKSASRSPKLLSRAVIIDEKD